MLDNLRRKNHIKAVREIGCATSMNSCSMGRPAPPRHAGRTLRARHQNLPAEQPTRRISREAVCAPNIEKPTTTPLQILDDSRHEIRCLHSVRHNPESKPRFQCASYSPARREDRTTASRRLGKASEYSVCHCDQIRDRPSDRQPNRTRGTAHSCQLTFNGPLANCQFVVFPD